MLQLFCYQQNNLAQDSIAVPKPSKPVFKPNPMEATMLAFAFPGLGQIYNRRYWKVPFVYAGFGGLIYSIGFNTAHYNEYMKAYQDFTDNIPETDSYVKYVKAYDQSQYDPVVYPESYNPSTAAWVKDGLINSVDYYKRYRDLSYIGFAAWYIISVLDANVDASLYNYDISENLNLTVAPLQLPIPGFQGPGVRLCLQVTF
jgi:hypothetical protein